MVSRLTGHWAIEALEDEKTFAVLSYIAGELAALTLHEKADGTVLVFTDDKERIRHVVVNVGENNWVCFCPDALDGECAATSYARARLLRDLEAFHE